jgi:hypothetical protein
METVESKQNHPELAEKISQLRNKFNFKEKDLFRFAPESRIIKIFQTPDSEISINFFHYTGPSCTARFDELGNIPKVVDLDNRQDEELNRRIQFSSKDEAIELLNKVLSLEPSSSEKHN